jgi:hypothetical protein
MASRWRSSGWNARGPEMGFATTTLQEHTRDT